MPFYRAKGRLSHLKRASFIMQKGIFYFIKKHLLFSIYESLLQPFLCPFSFHNKRLSLPLHYYNNTIKTTTFQFSCHSCHSSLHHNALITKYLCEMLKVTATKNKNYVRSFRVTMNYAIPKTVSEEICIFAHDSRRSLH